MRSLRWLAWQRVGNFQVSFGLPFAIGPGTLQSRVSRCTKLHARLPNQTLNSKPLTSTTVLRACLPVECKPPGRQAPDPLPAGFGEMSHCTFKKKTQTLNPKPETLNPKPWRQGSSPCSSPLPLGHGRQ